MLNKTIILSYLKAIMSIILKMKGMDLFLRIQLLKFKFIQYEQTLCINICLYY